MRTFRAVVAFTLLLSMVAAGSAAAPASAERATYIVVLDDSVNDVEATARSLARGAGGELGFVYQHALKGFSAKLSAQAATALARNPNVAYVEADKEVSIAAQEIPTGISRIFADDNSAIGIDGSDDVRVDVDVAVIDTGIDLDHPCVAVDHMYAVYRQAYRVRAHRRAQVEDAARRGGVGRLRSRRRRQRGR